MRDIVGLIRNVHSEAQILLLTPSRADGSAWDRWAKALGAPDVDTSFTRPLERAKAFADIVVKVGLDLQVKTINVFDLFEKQLSAGLSTYDLFYDGLHYTPKAYQVG